MTNILRAYRTSSAEGATHIGLLLSVYDALAEDIALSGEAEQNADLPARCRHSQHALLLLGHLESWVPSLEDATLEQSLLCFYKYIRAELLRLQTVRSREGFVELAMRVCEARAAWQSKQAQARSAIGDAEVDCTEYPDGGGDSRACWSA